MIGIECTRCGATESGFPTYQVAKFSLTHERGCGAKIGIPKYSTEKKPQPATKAESPKVEATIKEIKKTEVKITEALKPKKQTFKKKDNAKSRSKTRSRY